MDLLPRIPSRDTGLTGVFENWERIGEIAVDVLVAMLNRGERGVPDLPQRLHVEGPWVQGSTLRLAEHAGTTGCSPASVVHKPDP
jgi:LacI family transcriptional regulator/LacI family repressor for deo operon, udp, cdd, tsx, nupC, and nupG